MDNQVRIFRKNPIAWWDKNVMRHLRHKYGKEKKTFLLVRSVYLALCEIESDFNDKPINFFTKTVGTYAGLSREAAGKYINLLVGEGLIRKSRLKDQRTKAYISGSMVEIIGLENAVNKASEPVSAYPDIGLSQHRGNRAAIKKLSMDKKLNMNVNEDLKIFGKGEKWNVKSLKDILTQFGLKRDGKSTQPTAVSQREFLAQEMANKLGDSKSLGCYWKIADKVPQDVIYEILASVKDVALFGKIRQTRGALFVDIIKQYANDNNIDLGFKQQPLTLHKS